MRRCPVRRGLLFTLWLALIAAPALAAPCTTATSACTEWITPGTAPVRLLVYRSFPLDVKNADITRAVVLVHGAGRDADNYFLHILAAAFLGGALDNTIVLSPRFASTNNGCSDKVAEREAAWECSGPARWTSGGDAVGTPGVTSFDAMDTLLTRLAKRDAFPNLRTIVLAGHSAGGQFVSRYQMTNQVHDKLGVPLTYIVANPSSVRVSGSDAAVCDDDCQPMCRPLVRATYRRLQPSRSLRSWPSATPTTAPPTTAGRTACRSGSATRSV